jgi:deazaflavin-dependent oxidoreductase (nitroreductase family)
MSRSRADRVRGLAFEAGGRLLQVLEKAGPAVKDNIAKTLAGLHVKAYKLTGGRFVSNPGAPSLLLTTTGRKTGQPRTTALFYLPDGERQVLVASYAGDARQPQWYLNLAADPNVTVQIGGDVWESTATLVTGAERAALWPRLVENWPGYADYQTRTTRELPVVALTARAG